MKRFFLVLMALMFGSSMTAQDKYYLLFEFMKVDNEQVSAYMETENFWEKIHAQRVKNGDVIGWDLWALQPGGENQGPQYMTVHVYDDPVKMMSGAGDFDAAVKAAYPNMTAEQVNDHLEQDVKNRDLAYRLYLESVASTEDEFDMPLGTVIALNMMRATDMDFASYEKAETEVFLPWHQKAVERGDRSRWELLRIMVPYGSETYATHVTADMFKDYAHMLSPGTGGDEPTAEQQQQMQDGIKTRDMKFTYIARLIKKVR